MAIIDAGIGKTQWNTILSALNIPVLSPTTFKRHEEAYVTDNNNISSHIQSLHEPEEPVDLAASFDTAWQRRGTGHSYNSMSGHSSLIGHNSKKILSYDVRTKACAKCNRGHRPDDHDCRKNFEGSAKSMEPEMAVRMVVNNDLLKNEGARISVLIGDDDSSTIAAVQRESTTKVEKWSDLNHSAKGLTNALYKAHVPTKIIPYLSRCFNYTIKQNQGDPAAKKKQKTNKEQEPQNEENENDETTGNYRYKGLPKGQPLSDPVLRSSLTSIFARFARNSEKLVPCASSQANESFNHTVASKAPKSRFYAGSESLH
ncbi:uncharacterized protein [Venturia canescens]|uniref:uncharacterized protein n=1 Tax=Venturia canescens TaxID=32260 RepID=UPI001C9D5CCB|nr:uncharacterized protein LOC122410488 [Venturia canescens]